MTLYNTLIERTLIIVPCYNAEKTIQRTIKEILKTGFTNIVIGDDSSNDNTVEICKLKFPNLPIIVQKENLGYGGNQKVLYEYGIKSGFEYIIMIHGDYQYTPKLIPTIASMLHFSDYDFVFGSRILGGKALKGGMPFYKYIANRILTLFQNLITGYKLSEYHSGLRGFKTAFLKKVDYNSFSNKFIFDNQIILSVIENKGNIGEVSCITKYDQNSSSINFSDSIKYGSGVIRETLVFIKKVYFNN